MYGGGFGEGPFGDEIQPWVAIVEGTGNLTGDGAVTPVGGSTAQGISNTTADGVVAPVGRAIWMGGGTVEGRSLVAPTGVSVIPSIGSLTGDGVLAPRAIAVTLAIGSVSQSNTVAAVGLAIGSSSPDVDQFGDVDAVGGSIAQGISEFQQAAVVEVFASASENPPTVVARQPMMLPLVYSNEDNQVEAELKALFIKLFEKHIREDERFTNALGMPHHGSRELIEQSLAADGLSIYRGSSVGSGAGAYLLRAWRAHNPKRGLHLLKTYLQLLWPNVWTATQMWQDKDEPYPEALVNEDEGNHFLTSRVHVTLPARVSDGGDLNAIQAGLRASLPARFVLNLAVTEEASFEIGLTSAYYRGVVSQHYEGNFQ